MADDPSSAPAPALSASRITMGTPLTVNKNTFQAVVVRVSTRQELPAALQCVRQLPRLRRFHSFPCAARVSCPGAAGSGAADSTAESPERLLSPRPILRPQPHADSSEAVFESWDDDAQPGVGDRLLHLLQRWQVGNVLLVVARRDASLCQRLIGAELFRLALEAAKLSLEQYYLESIKPSEAAKIELLENPAPAPSQSQSHPQPQPQSQTRTPAPAPAQSPAVRVMDSDSIPSWPKRHEPTSDGGGRKCAKQGRINHFMHRYGSPRSPRKTAPRSPSPSPRSNNDPASHAPADGELAVDGTASSGGVDWLGISRDEWLQLRAIRVPVKELHYLFMCLVLLLDAPPEQRAARKAAPTPKAQEEFTPSDFSWPRCREILHHASAWGPRLRELRGAALAKSQASALRAIFQEPGFTSDAFVRISVAGAKIFAWLQRLLDEYDEKDLGLLPNQHAEPLEALEVLIDAGAPRASAKSPRAKKQQSGGDCDRDGKARAEAAGEFDGLLSLARAPKPKIVDRGRLFGTNHNLSGSR